MRFVCLLLLMAALTGCQKSFDEKYADTEARLKADAARLDQQMDKAKNSEMMASEASAD